jgi:hypothetical protein
MTPALAKLLVVDALGRLVGQVAPGPVIQAHPVQAFELDGYSKERPRIIEGDPEAHALLERMPGHQPGHRLVVFLDRDLDSWLVGTVDRALSAKGRHYSKCAIVKGRYLLKKDGQLTIEILQAVTRAGEVIPLRLRFDLSGGKALEL